MNKLLNLSSFAFLFLVISIAPSLAKAAVDTSIPTTSITSPANGATVSGNVLVSANASDVFSSCIITLFGQQFDVSVLRSTHTGGNIFQCGTDMTTLYSSQHGTNLNRVQPYLIPASYSGVTKVELYVDGSLNSTDTSSPYSFLWNSASTTNGSHSLQTRAFDQNNNMGTSTIVTVNVSNILPPNPTSTPPTSTPPAPTSTPATSTLPSFTEAQLAPFNGASSTLPIYIGLNGKVYDVSSAPQFYGLGGPYNYLTGRDSSVELNQIGGDIITSKYPVVGLLISAPTPPAPPPSPPTPATTSLISVAITSPMNLSIASGTINIAANATSNAGITKVELYVNGKLRAVDTAFPYSFSWDTTTAKNKIVVLKAKAYDNLSKTASAISVVRVANKSFCKTKKINNGKCEEKWREELKEMREKLSEAIKKELKQTRHDSDNEDDD